MSSLSTLNHQLSTLFLGKSKHPLRALLPVLALLGVLFTLTGCRKADGWTTLEGEAMGMIWRLQAAGGNGDAAALRAETEACFARWESAASLWREDSELARFNREPAGRWLTVSGELWAAVALAREIVDASEGALDITIGPLVDLWGFGSSGRRSEPPSGEEIQTALAACGWRHLEMDPAGQRLRKHHAGLQLNVNCVVEGLALDELAGRLKTLGHRHFLLELGGELLAFGKSPQGGPWRVAVQSPSGQTSETFSTLPLQNEALATSGTYRQKFTANGKAYSHIIDPRTGHPVTHRLASVSVIHPSCAHADAWATALLVLGSEQGRALAERLGLRVFWIEERLEPRSNCRMMSSPRPRSFAKLVRYRSLNSPGAASNTSSVCMPRIPAARTTGSRQSLVGWDGKDSAMPGSKRRLN